MAAIGQSDNLITPVQLATYAATIANNGTRLRTHVVDKITDYSRQTVLEETKPEVVEENIFDQEVLETVKGAMRNVVTSPSGTGYYSYGSYEIPNPRRKRETGPDPICLTATNMTWIILR